MMSQAALSTSSTLSSLTGSEQRREVLLQGSFIKFKSNYLTLGFNNKTRKGVRRVVSGVAKGNVGGIGTTEGERKPSSYIWPDKEKRPRVCILGGGFGGLYTALRLESLEWPGDKKPQVLLIDQSERFVFKPMLYELLTGEVDVWEIAPRFSDLLANTGIQFFQDRVKLLRPSDYEGLKVSTGSSSGGGTVHLESGFLVEYDWLVLALGAGAKIDLVPGAAEYALPFTTLEEACKVDDKIKILERKYFGKDIPIRAVVVGCGYSGVELAATISERFEDKGIVQAINVNKIILPTAPPGNREAALKILSSRKVELVLGYFVRSVMENNETRKIVLELQPAERGLESQTLEADIVLWTVGSEPLIPQFESRDYPYELPLNGKGQVETDETLCVRGHPRIFAIGDSSALRDSKGNLLPATAQVAFQQADFTGWNIWAAINGRPLLPFRFQNLGEMMTLGTNDAAITPSFIEGLTLDGPIGHAARKLAYLARLPTDEHRVKVGVSWLAKSAVDSIAAFQSTLAKALLGA